MTIFEKYALFFFLFRKLRIKSSGIPNKTAGHHQHFFPPSHFGKDDFLKMKAFFFKILCFFITCSNFSNFQIFVIFGQKNPQLKWKRLSQKKMPLYTQFTKTLPHLAILRKTKAFSKKPIFSKNSNFFRFEKSYYLSCILPQMCYNLVKRKDE